MLNRVLSAVAARLPKPATAPSRDRPIAPEPAPEMHRSGVETAPASSPDAVMRSVHEAVERELRRSGLVD